MIVRIDCLKSRFYRALTPLAAALLVACGSADDQKGSTTGAPTNQMPSWSDAPTAPIELGQGQTTSIPLTITDPDEGDLNTAVINPDLLPEGLEAYVRPETNDIEIHAGYTVMGPTSFTVQIEDGEGGHVDVEVSVVIKPLRWLKSDSWSMADGPEAREHGAFVVDTDKKRAILIGGSGYAPQGTPLADVWSYDLVTEKWSLLTPTGDVPPPAGSRRVAQIPTQKTAYLFGGYGAASAPTNDLYRVTFDDDAPVFSLVPQVGAPPARSLHMFTYDGITGRFFAFGGYGTKVLGDTWMMTIEGGEATWTKLSPDSSPKPRYGFFYGVDETNGRVIVFSGAQGVQTINAARDTWALDMRSDPPAWTLLLDGDAVPPGRRNGCSIFDPTGPRLFVFGGTANGMTSEPDLHVFDARLEHPAWTTLSLPDEPVLRSSGMGFYEPVSGRTFLGFGNDKNVYRDLSSLGY